MDLFAINCTTCKTRLRVREEGAIGQILACPKCGGMVMVKPPPNWSAGTQAKSEEPTITEVVTAGPRPDQTAHASAFEAVEDLLADAPPRAAAPRPAAAAAPPASPPASKPRFVGGPLPSAALAPPPPAESDVAPEPAAPAAPPWRYWALMAGSVAVGILLAFTAVASAMYFLRDETPLIAQAGGGNAPANPATAAPTTTPAVPPEAAPPASPGAPTPVPTPTLPATNDPPPVAPPVPPMPPAPEADPIGLVKPPSPTLPAANPNDPLARFDKLLGGGEDAEREAVAPAPSTRPPSDPATDRPALPRPPPRAADVPRRLADSLAGIETSGTPLADYLDRFSDLSTIPITLEPDWLAFAPATPESPIVFRASSTTVGDALAKSLETLRLSYTIVGDQLVVNLAQPKPQVTIQVKVKELAGDETRMAELADLLKALIEPASWIAGDGGSIAVDAQAGNLLVKHQKLVQAQVHLFCERLRTARQKPNVLKLNPELFQLASRSARAQERLLTPVTLNFSQPTRLTAILDRLGQAAGVRILVDWQGVASARWNPDADATLVASKQPLGEALDALLGPMELSWRAIDGRTLQVVTPARLAERAEIEFYPAADLAADEAAGEALRTKIIDALGPALFREGGGSGEVRLDPPSKCLIAALPQLKQRELEALLVRWREK